MLKLKNKHKGYKYGFVIEDTEPDNNISQSLRLIDEIYISDFNRFSGLTLKQLEHLNNNYHISFVMYDSITYNLPIDVYTPYTASGFVTEPKNYNETYIRLSCPITKTDFINKKDDIIDNVIAQKIMEYYEKGLLDSNNEDRFFAFLEEYFDKIEEEDNKTEKDDYNYIFGLYYNPKITHEESYLCGFRKKSIPIRKYIDFNDIKGRTIEEINSYTRQLKKDGYMYFLMLDSIPDSLKNYEDDTNEEWDDTNLIDEDWIDEDWIDEDWTDEDWIDEDWNDEIDCTDEKHHWIARYYYEINIEKYKDKLIEEVIRDAIQEELERETIKGSFYKRAHIFLDKYPVQSKEESSKRLKKSIRFYGQ